MQRHTNNIPTQYIRACPKCKLNIYYSTNRGLKNATKKNKLCNGCARKGRKRTDEQRNFISISTKNAMWKPEIRERFLRENTKGIPIRIKKLREWYKNPENVEKHKIAVNIGMENMSPDDKTAYYSRIQKLGKESKGKKLSIERKEYLSKINTGELNHFYGKTHNEENKKKYRLNFIKQKLRGGQIFPQYNIKSCEYFDWLNKWNGWNGQYAMHGNELYIADLGYWVDYYEPNLNIVIEWDESRHYDVRGNLKQKDVNRQNEIIKKLKCDFYRIKENTFEIYIKYRRKNGKTISSYSRSRCQSVWVW